jgi:CrcB protein
VRVVAIAVAGAAGALARYGVGRAFGVRTFPWATLAINLVGSFLFGLLLGTATSRNWSELTTLTLGTGFLGAFTTFSTFSYESYTLLRTDRIGLAATYLAVSVAGGLVTAAIGWSLGRHVL